MEAGLKMYIWQLQKLPLTLMQKLLYGPAS